MLCGIDLGTSSLKCTLFADNGQPLGSGRSPVSLRRDDSSGAALSDPAEWERACALAIADAFRLSGQSPGDVDAVAVSGNGPTLVAVDASGRPVGGALSWLDRRAVGQAERISAAAGRAVDPSFYLPKALSVLEGPDGRTVTRFFSGPEYLAYRLGADACSYLPDPYYETYVWDVATAQKLGLSAALFPPYVGPGQRIGRVGDLQATVFGLKRGTPIASAYPDFLAALLGSGSVEPGIACDRSGSSEALNLCASGPCPDQRLFSLPHAVPGLWNLSGGLSTSGAALAWFAKTFGYADAQAIRDDVSAGEPGARGLSFLPYLAGERAPLWNPDLRASFHGVSLGHERRDFARAAVEALAYGLRVAADIMRENGNSISAIRCSGGAATDSALCGIKADVLGVPVETLQVPDCETLGDACAASVALGRHSGVAEASADMVRIGFRHAPNPSKAAAYEGAYARWKAALDSSLALPPTERR